MAQIIIPENIKPTDGRFGCGRSRMRPEQFDAFTKFASEHMGTRLRQAPIKALVGELKDGLNPSEFAKMTIESKDENVNMKSFEITLARGARAISIKTYERNIVDLNSLKANARSGDRIVIDIKSTNIKNESTSTANTIFVIKVN